MGQSNSDLVGVDLIIFGFASMDGLHVESVAQDEGDALLGAQVSEPVPGKGVSQVFCGAAETRRYALWEGF